MATEVNQAWKSLTPEQQKHTQIYADNYGEAGAIHHFSKQYHLPDVISLNSSFTLWAPDNLGAQYIIYVDNKDGGNIKKFASYLESYRKIGEVHNPWPLKTEQVYFCWYILSHSSMNATEKNC